MTKEEQNKAIARRYYDEILNQGKKEVIDELMSQDFLFTISTQSEPFHGPQGFKQMVDYIHTAWPDVHITVEHLLADGDTVVGHWTGSGTHRGIMYNTVMGDIPPTNRRFTIDGMTWLTIRNGKIVESLANEDTLGMLLQLGVLNLGGPEPVRTSPEQNKVLMRRYFNEIMNQNKQELIDELLSPTFAFRIPTRPEPIRGRDGMRGFVTLLHNAFPDIHFQIDREMAEGDKAAARWTISGTHKGEFLGAPASGNRIEDHGVDIFRIANGQIEEIFVNENDLGLMQQMGVIPKGPAATK